MQLDPELERLGVMLTRAGHTVVPHGDHLCLRLSFFTSVRIRLLDEALHLEHRFGLVTREWSVLTSVGLLGAVTVGAFAVQGPGVLSFALAFVSVLSASFDAMRVAISEGAATRVQLAWSMLDRSLEQVESKGALTAPGTPAALPGGSPESSGAQPLRTPRESVR